MTPADPPADLVATKGGRSPTGKHLAGDAA